MTCFAKIGLKLKKKSKAHVSGEHITHNLGHNRRDKTGYSTPAGCSGITPVPSRAQPGPTALVERLSITGLFAGVFKSKMMSQK